MSFLGRLLGRREAPSEPRPSSATSVRDDAASPEPERAPEAVSRSFEATALERLATTGAPGGPDADEALALLGTLRGTEHESRALATVVERRARCPEPLLVAAADLARSRGDDALALSLVDGARSIAALVLAADVLAERGDLARAVAAIERVLARDIDAPGARERHARWSERLGGRARPAIARDDATLATADTGTTPFRILREVARGGAGVVYEAEDELLGRRVAYKVHHRRGRAREQLLREASVAAALSGPGIVRVFDASPDDGWIALEWITRGSLRDALRRGALDLVLPVEGFAIPLARALARVHAKGWVHADLKPANVLLRAPGDPVLSDFGIARRPGERSEAGSAGYVPPERLAGAAAEPADDVYAFGRVLEDVLEAAERHASGRDHSHGPDAAWRRAADACLAPADARPRDGATLLSILP